MARKDSRIWESERFRLLGYRERIGRVLRIDLGHRLNVLLGLISAVLVAISSFDVISSFGAISS